MTLRGDDIPQQSSTSYLPDPDATVTVEGPWEVAPFMTASGGFVVFRSGDKPMFETLTRRDALCAARWCNILESLHVAGGLEQ